MLFLLLFNLLCLYETVAGQVLRRNIFVKQLFSIPNQYYMGFSMDSYIEEKNCGSSSQQFVFREIGYKISEKHSNGKCDIFVSIIRHTHITRDKQFHLKLKLNAISHLILFSSSQFWNIIRKILKFNGVSQSNHYSIFDDCQLLFSSSKVYRMFQSAFSPFY